MIPSLGRLLVLLSLLVSTIGAVLGYAAGWKQSPDGLKWARRFAFAFAALMAAATFVMEYALITHDFSVGYVEHVGSRDVPLWVTIVSLWSSLEGSILFWGFILGIYIAAATWLTRNEHLDYMAYAIGTWLFSGAFFSYLIAAPASPFQTVANPPLDGPGPNPLLQNHVLMAIHPPILYLGYVGMTIPFAFAVAALITGRVGEGWLLETRRATLVAWAFLSVGIVLGAWWSYEVLGWGGYWAWDPVENASFIPWLTATAYIHSVVVQERRGMLRVWTLSLLLATFSLTILGTFLTRSGVLDSVHAFSESAIGPAILGFFALVVLVGVGLIGWRGDRLRSAGSIDSPVSREGAFLANNVLFAGFAFVVLLGTVFPLVAEALNGERISVGKPYFSRMTMPIGLALLFLMAVAPALPWRKASGELLRKRLQWPAWIGTVVVVLCVVLGVRGLGALLGFGLGAFAGAAAIRQLVLSARRQGWRGVVGRANGGMLVHVGIVVIAV